MNQVINGPVETMVFRPTKVRELLFVRGRDMYHEDITPPVVPDFSEPCPTCGGKGYFDHIVPPFSWDALDCRTCKGTGFLKRVWKAEEVCEHLISIYDSSHHCVGQSLAVVSWFPVIELPVWDGKTRPSPFPAAHIDLTINSYVSYLDDLYQISYPLDEENWASDLNSYCVVVAPGVEVKLDKPITKMWWKRVPGDYMPDVVPISLNEGLNSVNLFF